MEAALHDDRKLAGMVVADDDRIDALYHDVHRGLLGLMAQQAPVATHLRVIAALMDVIHHVERMGDQCVNIAKTLVLSGRSEERRVGKSVDLGGRRIIKKKK